MWGDYGDASRPWGSEVEFKKGIPCDTAFDFLAGQFPIPTIWAEPDSVVTKGQSVTIWCFGTEEAQVYYLYKKEGSKSLKPQTVFEPGNKANFSIPFTTEYHAGRYHCYYYSPAGLSEQSNTLELVVTGKGLTRVPSSGYALSKGF